MIARDQLLDVVDVKDLSARVEIKSLNGDLRRARLMDALKYEAEWEERRAYIRKYQVDRREAKRLREESEAMKAEGKCWAGKHRGTLWADMDFDALQWLATNTSGDLQVAAEAEMMRQLGLLPDGEVTATEEEAVSDIDEAVAAALSALSAGEELTEGQMELLIGAGILTPLAEAAHEVPPQS